MAGRILHATLVPFLLCLQACNSKTPSPSNQQLRSTGTAATSSAHPLDHLAPGELQASSALVFGLKVPDTMTVERSFPNEVHLVGIATADALLRYIQAHAQTAAPELRGNSILISRAVFTNSPPGHVYRIEISTRGRTARMRITDTPPADTTSTEHLTDEEQWRRAGFKANGEPLDVQKLR